MVPWPDGSDTCSVPGYPYTLRCGGRRLNGRRVRYLGRGGEGYVYYANSSDSRSEGRSLAVKFLADDGADSEPRVKAILSQASGLVHEIGTNELARTYDVLDLRQHRGTGWPSAALVMDFFPCSLQDVVNLARTKRWRLPLSLAGTWARQVARGLQDLHEKQLVHRDIKASNILFRLRERANWCNRLDDLIGADAVITDFGTLDRLGQPSDLVVCRQAADDPWKHPEFYPFRRDGNPPPSSAQVCHPYMDIFAYGEVLRVLASLSGGTLS